MKLSNSTIIDNPRIRLPTIDSGRLKNNKNSMIALIEVDITFIREQIRELHRQKILFSFTSCIIKIIGDCVAEKKAVQAILLNDRKLVLFNDVDISISVERFINNAYYPFPLILRSVNKKNILEIDKEINDAIGKNIFKEEELFMPKRPKLGKAILKLFYTIPSKLRVILMSVMIRNPINTKNVMGTVGFATVNMTGRLSGWSFPAKNPYSLYLALGSVNKKPLVVKNEIKIRDVLNMTAIFDHNVIDGTPARNFMNYLVNRIENGVIEADKK